MLNHRQYFADANVLFATNGGDKTPCINDAICLVKPYAEHIYVCPDNKYGCSAFDDIIKRAVDGGYDYVIYFDADCFIYSADNLRRLFDQFKAGGYCFAGMPDGNMVKIRAHNTYLINPFLSFFDVKKCVKS